MTFRVKFTLSASNIVLFHKNKMFNIPSTYRKFNDLREHLKLAVHDIDFIESIIDLPKEIARASGGHVSVVGNTVYYKDMVVRSVLTERLLSLLDDGFEISPWINFMNKIMLNPSESSRNSLFEFLDKHQAPICDDGDFLAFKRIRHDWMDIHSGTMLNKPGMIVSMDRSLVNPDNSQTCSSGLHVAASIYLDSFNNAPDSRTIVCKVNPIDVVSVPDDYNHSKMRVCRYEVLDEVEIGNIKAIEETNVYVTQSVPVDDIYDYYTPSNDFYNSEDSEDETGYYEPLTVAKQSIIKTHETDDNGYVFVTSSGKRITQKDLLDGIAQYHGVTAWAKANDVPRSTAQGWVKKIMNHPIEVVKPVEVKPVEVDTPNVFDFSTNSGKTFTITEVLDGVKTHKGVTAWANAVGIARSTAQGWIKKIYNSDN